MLTFPIVLFKIQDLIFTHDGDEIICCCDLISKDSSDRNIMAWDTKAGVVLSNQIYQVKFNSYQEIKTCADFICVWGYKI